ncbi:MAG: hypothetical protein HZB11_01945 [Candidatus Yonathbacteria bacterium]|nr:hypothetical protein [Candidatus Yonathbacteria bacterium]
MQTKIILILIVLVTVIFGGAFFFVKGGPAFFRGEKATSWYAVHLSNGQNYFGHITELSSDKIVVSGAYYLEKYEMGDSTVSQSKNFSVQQMPKQVYQLVRQGDDKNTMTDNTIYINRSSVLFWEKLSADSEVVKSITGGRK